MRFVIAVVVAFAVVGCPPADQKSSPGPGASEPAVCTKVGQSCEVSPGKLGTCVQKDDCPAGSGCFVCQSQH